MWIYIGLILLLGAAAVVGQVAYTRALARAGVAVPGFVKVLRAINLGLVGVTLAAVVIYVIVRS